MADLQAGHLFPPFAQIRTVSARLMAAVADFMVRRRSKVHTCSSSSTAAAAAATVAAAGRQWQTAPVQLQCVGGGLSLPACCAALPCRRCAPAWASHRPISRLQSAACPAPRATSLAGRHMPQRTCTTPPPPSCEQRRDVCPLACCTRTRPAAHRPAGPGRSARQRTPRRQHLVTAQMQAPLMLLRRLQPAQARHLSAPHSCCAPCVSPPPCIHVCHPSPSPDVPFTILALAGAPCLDCSCPVSGMPPGIPPIRVLHCSPPAPSSIHPSRCLFAPACAVPPCPFSSALPLPHLPASLSVTHCAVASSSQPCRRQFPACVSSVVGLTKL